MVELEDIKVSAGEGSLSVVYRKSQRQHLLWNKKQEQEASLSYPLWTVSYNSFSRLRSAVH
jgi:hypothetical protein